MESVNLFKIDETFQNCEHFFKSCEYFSMSRTSFAIHEHFFKLFEHVLKVMNIFKICEHFMYSRTRFEIVKENWTHQHFLRLFVEIHEQFFNTKNFELANIFWKLWTFFELTINEAFIGLKHRYKYKNNYTWQPVINQQIGLPGRDHSGTIRSFRCCCDSRSGLVSCVRRPAWPRRWQ